MSNSNETAGAKRKTRPQQLNKGCDQLLYENSRLTLQEASKAILDTREAIKDEVDDRGMNMFLRLAKHLLPKGNVFPDSVAAARQVCLSSSQACSSNNTPASASEGSLDNKRKRAGDKKALK